MAKSNVKAASCGKTSYGRNNVTRKAIETAINAESTAEFTFENFVAGLFPGTWSLKTENENFLVFSMGKNEYRAVYVDKEGRDLRPDDDSATNDVHWALESWSAHPEPYNQTCFREEKEGYILLSWNEISGCHYGKLSAIQNLFKTELATRRELLAFKFISQNIMPEFVKNIRMPFNLPEIHQEDYVENWDNLVYTGMKRHYFTL